MRVNPFYISNLVSALDQTQATEQQLSAQASGGARFSSLGEDPVASGRNVMLLSQIQRDDSFTQTSSLVTGQLQVADSALGSVVTQLTQALSLATGANNGTMNASDVKAISNQIAGILSEVESLANTSYQGQYIFAGGQTSTVPFSTSTATSPGVTTYSGDGDINYLETPNGQKIQMNVPGDAVFTAGGASSVFGALNALVADYAQGAVNLAQASADTKALTKALHSLSEQRVIIDNSMTQLTASQTDLMQADMAKVATQLALTKTQQTALEAIIAQLGSGSLFDKL